MHLESIYVKTIYNHNFKKGNAKKRKEIWV